MPKPITRPTISWPDFLQAAPYFNTLATISLHASQAPTAGPLVRAAYYFDIFSGEVSNGGVMQYFFNHAGCLPGFDQAVDFVAAHPALADAVPFMAQAHAAWQAVAPQVLAARGGDEWTEELSHLFKSNAHRFEALQREFFAVRHDIQMRLAGAIVRAPRDYFDIEALPGLRARGLSRIALQGDTVRLRFEDGFPVGPNLFEQEEDGSCHVVWFSRDRALVEVDRSDLFGGSRSRSWMHYPSLSSAMLNFDEQGALESHRTRRSLWYDHGLQQRFHPDGACSDFELHLRETNQQETLRVSVSHYPDGAVRARRERREDGLHTVTYWPNGQVNTRSVKVDDQDRERHAGCFDEQGVELAPGGNGPFRQILGIEGQRTWGCEGRLVDGYFDGTLAFHESDLDGRNRRPTFEKRFRRGVEEPAS